MKLSEQLLDNYNHGLYSVCFNGEVYIIFSHVFREEGNTWIRYSMQWGSVEDTKGYIGSEYIIIENVDSYYKGHEIIDTMQPWEVMGQELLPVGTEVEILVGGYKGTNLCFL